MFVPRYLKPLILASLNAVKHLYRNKTYLQRIWEHNLHLWICCPLQWKKCRFRPNLHHVKIWHKLAVNCCHKTVLSLLMWQGTYRSCLRWSLNLSDTGHSPSWSGFNVWTVWPSGQGKRALLAIIIREHVCARLLRLALNKSWPSKFCDAELFWN